MNFIRRFIKIDLRQALFNKPGLQNII